MRCVDETEHLDAHMRGNVSQIREQPFRAEIHRHRIINRVVTNQDNEVWTQSLTVELVEIASKAFD